MSAFRIIDKPRLARKVQMQGAPEERAADGPFLPAWKALAGAPSCGL